MLKSDTCSQKADISTSYSAKAYESNHYQLNNHLIILQHKPFLKTIGIY